MLMGKFGSICEKLFNRHLDNVTIRRESINIDRTRKDISIYFPTHLILMKFPGYLGVELTGASKNKGTLRTKKIQCSDIADYFDLFGRRSEENPTFVLQGSGISFTYITMGAASEIEAIRMRFPYIDLYPTRIVNSNERAPLLSFGERFRSLSVSSCIVTNKKDEFYRCRNILFAAFFSQHITEKEIIYFITKKLEESFGGRSRCVHGVLVGQSLDENVNIASYLQNLYLYADVRETTIGDFLNSHRRIIMEAFDCDRLLYEPILEWKEPADFCKRRSINPDFIIRHTDGSCEIVDLKLALLSRRRLTKGPRERRRFIDQALEGIAQLSNYQEYFDYKMNREFARRKYGIYIKSPKATLVVGNMENFDTQEVREAMRSHNGNHISIIDYDTLVSLFVSKGRVADANHVAEGSPEDN